MMKLYTGAWHTYHNGEHIDCGLLGRTLTNTPPEDTVHELTWENLDEWYYNHGGSGCGFNIWNFKKGRLVSFFEGSLFKKNRRDVKEWKSPLNIAVQYCWREIEAPSMELLNKFDAVKVQKYLAERA